MKVNKGVICANIAALAVNGVIVWLLALRTFPPLLGIAIFVALLAGAVWLSCRSTGRA